MDEKTANDKCTDCPAGTKCVCTHDGCKCVKTSQRYGPSTWACFSCGRPVEDDGDGDYAHCDPDDDHDCDDGPGLSGNDLAMVNDPRLERGSSKTAMDNPFDGYGRPFSDDGGMSDAYYHDNPANNVGPYAGPSSYSINTVVPYAPPHEGEEDPGQNVGPYNPPGFAQDTSGAPEAAGDTGEGAGELRVAYKRWNDKQWFDGTSSSIYDRALEAENFRRQANEFKDGELQQELVAQIEVLGKVAAEYDDSSLHDLVDDLPGGSVALEYDNLIDAGLVDVTSFLHVGAHQVSKQAAEYDWNNFQQEGARSWIASKVPSNPGMLAHQMVTREAAIDYAKSKTMILMDPVHRANIIDEFVNNAEVYRRTASAELDKQRQAQADRIAQVEAARREAADPGDWSEEFLPGAYTDLSYEKDEDGYLNIGPDDGTHWYAEAKQIIESNADREWKDFTTDGAREWFYAQASDNQTMLKHDDVTARSAKSYAQKETSLLPDEALKNEIVRAFVSSVEFLRATHIRREAARPVRESTEFEDIYEGETEILW